MSWTECETETFIFGPGDELDIFISARTSPGRSSFTVTTSSTKTWP